MQLFVFTSGFTLVDHFQPGWKIARPKVTPPNSTSSNRPLSNERFSSGAEKAFFFISVMTLILFDLSLWFVASPDTRFNLRTLAPDFSQLNRVKRAKPTLNHEECYGPKVPFFIARRGYLTRLQRVQRGRARPRHNVGRASSP